MRGSASTGQEIATVRAWWGDADSKEGDEMTTGICQYCGCEESTPCQDGCGWVDKARTLCSSCEGASTVAELFHRVPYHVRRETPPAFATLAYEERKALVMTTRHVLDSLVAVLEEREADDEHVATEQLSTLGLKLLERYPDRVREALKTETSIVDLILALLDDKRIVLATA